MNVLLANVQVDFKKCPSRPGFANDLGFSSPKFILKMAIESKLTKNSGHLVTKTKVLQPNSSAWDKTTNQISKCLNLFSWLGSRAGGQPFYTQKSRANLTKTYFDFSFWARKPTEQAKWVAAEKNEKHTWTPMSNEHPRIHVNSSEFHKRCSWQVRFWTIVFTFFDLLLCAVVFAFVGVIFLLVFGFSSCAGLALPKTIHCHGCKICFFLA